MNHYYRIFPIVFLFIIIPAALSAQDRDIVPPDDYGSDKNAHRISFSIPNLPKTSDSREHYVVEPVFNSNVYVYESGVNHPISIVLIHGVGNEGSRIWGHLVKNLANQYHLITFDLPGFGRSEKQNSLYSPDNYAAFVKWITDRYVKNSFIIIGHSLGGGVALCYAANYPKNLKRLILADVSGVIHRLVLTKHTMNYRQEKHFTINTIPKKVFSKLKKKTMDILEYETLPDDIETVLNSPSLREKILRSDPVRIAGLSLANYNFSNVLNRIKIPVMILWGANDAITPLRTGKLLVSVLPKTRLQVIPGSGHSPMIDNPKRFNQLVKTALVTQITQTHRQPHKKTNRKGIFRGEHNIKLSGYYKYIEISNCRNVHIKNLEAEHIEIFRSEVVIENSRITGTRFALNAQASTLTLTNVELKADTAIIASGSTLDLAGVKLYGRKSAVQAVNGSNLLFSVSKVKSPYTNSYLHGLYKVTRRRPL